MKENDGHTM